MGAATRSAAPLHERWHASRKKRRRTVRSGIGNQRSVNSIDPTQADGEASVDDTTPLAPTATGATPVPADEAEALAFDDATIDELLDALGPDPEQPVDEVAEPANEPPSATGFAAEFDPATEFVDDTVAADTANEPSAAADAAFAEADAPSDQPTARHNPEFAVLLDEGVDQDAEALEDAPTAAEALEAVFGDCAIVPPRNGRPALAGAVAELSDEVVAAIDATIAADSASRSVTDDSLAADHELHDVLSELRDHLASNAASPSEALAATLRDGFLRTQEELAQTNANLANLTAQLANLQSARPVRVVLNGASAVATPVLPPRPMPRDTTTPTVVAATLLLLGWAGILWWKTGDARVAIAAAAAANGIACFAFFGRRNG